MTWSCRRGCTLPTGKDDPEALAMFREAMKCQHGGDRKSEQIKSNNVTLDPVVDATTGNSRAYSIYRVKRECDEETEYSAAGSGDGRSSDSSSLKRRLMVGYCDRKSQNNAMAAGWIDHTCQFHRGHSHDDQHDSRRNHQCKSLESPLA